MRSFKLTILCIFLFSGFSVLKAEINKPDNDKPTLLQIEDKYNEVKLCLTKTSIYMQIKPSVKNYINQEIVNRHSVEANQFIDSQGHFLLGEVVLLDSDKIEYSFDNLENVSFENGKLSFDYHKESAFTFEDILGTRGNPALENFFVEDLEKFYLNYKKLAG